MSRARADAFTLADREVALAVELRMFERRLNAAERARARGDAIRGAAVERLRDRIHKLLETMQPGGAS